MKYLALFGALAAVAVTTWSCFTNHAGADDCFNLGAKSDFCLKEAVTHCIDQLAQGPCEAIKADKDIMDNLFFTAALDKSNVMTNGEAVCYNQYTCLWDDVGLKCIRLKVPLVSKQGIYKSVACAAPGGG